MIPAEDEELYYSKRRRSALAMAEASADPAARNIHLEMARQYATLAGEGADTPIAVLAQSTELVLGQLVTSISTVMKPPREAVLGKLFLRAPPKLPADRT